MGKKRMLVIDDNSMIRNLLEMDFEEDFEVEMAVNGTEGVAAAVSRPDVILLDINMPDMSGIEVMHHLSTKVETREIPVVVITASEYTEATRGQLQHYRNFKGFLIKTAPSEDIKEAVRLAML